MAHIKEPLGVDFFVEPQPLTDSERKAISLHIQNYKKKKGLKRKRKVVAKKKELSVAA